MRKSENVKSSLLALGQRDFYLAPSSGLGQSQALWCSRFPQQPLPHPIYLYNPPLGRQMESSQPGIFESVVIAVVAVVVVGLFLLWELHALISCCKYESRDEGESCEISSEVLSMWLFCCSNRKQIYKLSAWLGLVQQDTLAGKYQEQSWFWGGLLVTPYYGGCVREKVTGCGKEGTWDKRQEREEQSVGLFYGNCPIGANCSIKSLFVF